MKTRKTLPRLHNIQHYIFSKFNDKISTCLVFGEGEGAEEERLWGHYQAVVHLPPLSATHPYPPPPSQNNAPLTSSHPKHFRTHPHPPKIFSHQPPPTQNNASYTFTHYKLPKIFSQPLSATQNNAPTTSIHLKNSSSHPHSPEIWFS